MLAAAAAAIVVLVSGLFWFLGGSDDEAVVDDVPVVTSEPVVTEPEAVVNEPVSNETGIDFDAMVGEARLARDAGQIFNPAGANAIELFAAATNAYPDNAELAAEYDAVIGEALGLAESALLDARLDDAEAALQRIGSVDPGNARLPFLTAQLSQIQLRGYLVDARAAILDERFEDATSSLALARSLGASDGAEISTVEEELSAARNAQQSGEVLALANARLEEGDLLAPANDNARYYYELVLSNEPGNTAARQGLTVIANTLVLQARNQIDSGNFDAAQSLLGDVRAIDSENAELVAADAALINARDALAERERQAEAERLREIERQAEAERIAEAERQAEAERIAEAERQAEAERIAEAERQAEAERIAEAERQDAEARAAAERAAAEAAAATAAAEVADDDTSTNANEAVPGGAAGAASTKPATPGPETSTPATSDASGGATEPAVANTQPQTAPPVESAPVPISSLKRQRYVAPKYPRAAERRNLSGWVDVIFTVTTDGTVSNVDVRNSEPGQTFVNAAVRAVEKWEFDPIVENGVAVEKRTGVRLMFALE